MASVLACGFTNTKAEFLSVPQDDDDPLLLLLVAEAMVERMMEAPAVQAKRTYSIMMRRCRSSNGDGVFGDRGSTLFGFGGEKESGGDLTMT